MEFLDILDIHKPVNFLPWFHRGLTVNKMTSTTPRVLDRSTSDAVAAPAVLKGLAEGLRSDEQIWRGPGRDETPGKVAILGTRGIPAAYGGFESFAERFALHLVERGWDVSVYCQVEHPAPLYEMWRGVELISLQTKNTGAAQTAVFDLRATLHSLGRPHLPLVLGYNTAILSVLYKLAGRSAIMNMDGIEWQRTRWSPGVRNWLRANEWLGCHLHDHLIADHEEIKKHLEQTVRGDKITVIPYGAEPVVGARADILEPLGLKPGEFAVTIARMVPENSVLEAVRGWTRAGFTMPLVVLGNHTADDEFCREVVATAGSNVRFLGAIYDKDVVQSLRYFSRFHIHGHRVGGTNPSLVEALAAGSPILAHDNRFNRGVAQGAGLYFNDEDQLIEAAKAFIEMDSSTYAQWRAKALGRWLADYRWEKVLQAYEELCRQYQPVAARKRA